MTDKDVNIRPALLADLQEIVLLLEEVNLPVEDVSYHLDNFLVWFDVSLRGCIGLEIYDESALLRSAAVRSDSQGKGIGKRLMEKIESDCKKSKIKNISLTTHKKGAFKFYKKIGYKPNKNRIYFEKRLR